MRYFHAIWKLDNNRYSVRAIDYTYECVDLSYGNIEVPFNQVELIEVHKDEWLNSKLLTEYSPEVDGELRKDRNR
ncbi:hypothetical protein KFV08_07840 [Macrococcoides canis]|uniref:hypothetical protein n=1 Tax=Macrococcoides canis TaxID=1855823 RepID=UPI00207D3B8A|nr:hypothetical protein [Macrococcus canis]MCO4095728.1 hypothetical protein [Macrococcus canis]UTH08437.1 hypothetical protein KFV08_07840 [Macrococcus canis]